MAWNSKKAFELALVEANITQTELAKRVKTREGKEQDRRVVSRWKAGHGLSIRVIEDVCNALKIKMSDFVKLGEERE